MGDPLAPSTPTPEPVSPAEPGSFFQNLVDMYFAPRQAFSRIVKNPAWVIPLVTLMVVLALATTFWVSRVEDPGEFVKVQTQQLGLWDKMPEEARTRALSGAAASLERQRWVTPLLVGLFTAVLFPGLFWALYRFFYAGDVTFRQSVAIVTWSSLAVTLITLPLNLVIMASKDDWYIQLGEALQANPTLLVDRAQVAPFLWWLLMSLDLFSFWFMFLLALGYGVAIHKKTGSTIWAIVAPWALFVVARAGLMSLLLPGPR